MASKNLQGLRDNFSLLGEKNKVLVANRGEIPIRIFRSAHELSMRTVAIYSHEDRLATHRLKADEAYVIGEKGEYTPVGAYLAIDEIIDIAKKHNVDFIHPGYGFLSENSEFASKVAQAGITWIGPPSTVIDSVGDKVSARNLAGKANVPVVPGTPGPIESVEEALEFVKEYGYPVIIKAAFGGGGRGMRVVREGDDVADAFQRATSEAKTAFGNGTCFVERFLNKPKHIEVQLLADNYGNVVHLFERDCSVQRRHQKVVEVAPAKTLPIDVRNAILTDAVKLAKEAGYRNAGTAEFLVDDQNRHYFIEINPRIQVEHTITEEITGIDVVAAQIQIAAGASLPQLGLLQDKITTRGFAIQCRITTEDPSKNFQPDTGRLEVYRSSGGNGVRLDGGNAYAGAVISPHYDSMLVKCTCSGSTYEIVRRKMIRSLIEFRIRGVKTNIPFLLTLLTHPVFISGEYWTTYIDDTPQLFHMVASQNRAQKLLHYLADLAVNGSSIKGQIGLPKLKKNPDIPHIHDAEGNLINVTTPPPSGWRQVLLQEGPEEFAKQVRNYNGTLLMDTTWRDAHQSLLATRVRTIDLAAIAPTTAHALSGAFALECWGGATFDVAMRFLHEDPWERLRTLRKLVPNIPFQMLLRGANGVAYSSLPDNAIDHFVKQAKDNGVDIFRVFDALNDLDQLKVGVDAVKKAGGVVEATICYSGDMLQPGKKYNLDYYLEITEKIVAMGTHILGIKDMAGTLKPAAAKLLIGSLRAKYPNLPIHVHSHDSAGTAVASMAQCALAGADVVDVAINSMSGMTSQASINALLASLDGLVETGVSEQNARELDAYWAEMRLLYSCFEADLKGPDPEVYEHEIPGGQLTNLLFQAQQLGLGEQWAETKRAYREANHLLGDIVKVTPTSKVVGDLAQFMVTNKLNSDDVKRLANTLDFPDSIMDFFEGLIGQPYGGFPEPLRSDVLRNKRRKLTTRPGLELAPFDLASIKEDLETRFGDISECDVASYNMYPKVYEDFQKMRELYGDLSVLPTKNFLAPAVIDEEIEVTIEQGKTLIMKLQAIGDLNKETGTREVYFELNGELRKIRVNDNSQQVQTISKPKADNHDPLQIGAPMAGVIVEVKVHKGSLVKKGQPVAVLSAMKMEMVISSSAAGLVKEVLVNNDENVEASDLLVVLEEEVPAEKKE
ncbi:similar to Saccharomyces cerevisiae YGL062W PYC1 Pyruvate carboxylase isoform, cytoplasmic enzyme that converts pyruvate to oxaloacetate [Maudiozyma saulgeensis]|uniref:Pyruvate carboxylase n=1 Tax=Maudiozyma saulgeensis TaxID=1789683 RepID=A0A1X7R0L1_9SACH|nr:similar to Saccharomyces cerevisiae YGL062W PYC1 Pyruvate carboxylase isoform, cytoplasmic enzyme that converts pyruvate to oxaloacetate [Kazachstania saulgeensis]